MKNPESLFLIGIFTMGLFSSLCSKNKEQIFWNWFINNSEKIYNFEKNQEKIFDEIANELDKLNLDLTFEIGPVENNKRDFVISAGGIKSAFPAVEKLYDTRPNLNNWNIIKFRPRRMLDNSITYQNLTIKPEDIRYLFIKDDNPKKIGILLFIKGYKPSESSPYIQIGYLFLDQIIGEYDVETHVGTIDFMDFDSNHFQQSKPITQMANEFDRNINN